MAATTIPACCICDPAACAADDTGEHCNDRSCGSCLHGCPAPDGQCCNAASPDLEPDVTTTNDIDATEPANNAFVVWYDPYNEPYAVYFRSDANGEDECRWFNADQHHSGGTEPSAWDDLCEELYGHDGPHLLVPGHIVTLTANKLAANENLRLREQVYAQKPVIDAALAWAEMCEDGGLAPDDCRKSEDALHDAVESYRLMDMALTSAREEQAEVAS